MRNLLVMAQWDGTAFSGWQHQPGARTVQSLGIIHFLALIERLDRLITPIVERTGGRLLKREADNIFAVFESVESAVECADQILFTVRAANEPLPAADEIDVSLGLGYGEVIQIGENDLFGDEMNLACKLGEDLAERHELLTLDLLGLDRPIVTLPNAAIRALATAGGRLRLPLPFNPEVIPYATLFWFMDNTKARVELGLTFRSAPETLAPTLAWLQETGRFPAPRVG